jgi:transposase-like protein
MWKDPTSDNAIRRWLKQFQETGGAVAAIETVTPQMLENTCREIECRLDILRATKGAHVEVF